MIRRPPRPTLFPSPPLSRSHARFSAPPGVVEEGSAPPFLFPPKHRQLLRQSARQPLPPEHHPGLLPIQEPHRQHPPSPRKHSSESRLGPSVSATCSSTSPLGA